MDRFHKFALYPHHTGRRSRYAFGFSEKSTKRRDNCLVSEEIQENLKIAPFAPRSCQALSTLLLHPWISHGVFEVTTRFYLRAGCRACDVWFVSGTSPLRSRCLRLVVPTSIVCQPRVDTILFSLQHTTSHEYIKLI